MYCQFMFNSCSTNHSDIKDSTGGETAADMARGEGYHALADYVEGFQPGPRGELTISCYIHSSQYRLHGQYNCRSVVSMHVHDAVHAPSIYKC